MSFECEVYSKAVQVSVLKQQTFLNKLYLTKYLNIIFYFEFPKPKFIELLFIYKKLAHKKK